MDPGLITPFISSVQNVFATMLQLPVSVGDASIKAEPVTAFDVSGIIGMSGDVVGSVVLSFPKETAERLVSLFTGTTLVVSSPDFADAIGELVNMVAGGAKAGFPGNRKVSISCPSVVIGAGHTVAQRSDVACIDVPCTTDCGRFSIEIAIQERKPAGVPVAAKA